MDAKLFWYPINSIGNSIAATIENNIGIILLASALFIPFFDNARYT